MAFPERIYRWRADQLQGRLSQCRREIEEIMGRESYVALFAILEAIRTAKDSETLGVEVLAALGQPKRRRGAGKNEQREVAAEVLRQLAGIPFELLRDCDVVRVLGSNEAAAIHEAARAALPEPEDPDQC